MEQYRTASLFNIPVVKWNTNSVGLSILTLQQIAHFSNVTSNNTAVNKNLLNYNKPTVGNTASISLGGILNIDPSLNIPFLPVIGYWHQFANGLELDINLPSRFGLKQPLSHRLWLNAGTNITGNISFFNNQTYAGIPADVNYTSMELKTGVGLEYLAGKKIMIRLNSGIFSNLKSRAFDKDKKASYYFLESNFSSVPFVNLTLSVLPFR